MTRASRRVEDATVWRVVGANVMGNLVLSADWVSKHGVTSLPTRHHPPGILGQWDTLKGLVEAEAEMGALVAGVVVDMAVLDMAVLDTAVLEAATGVVVAVAVGVPEAAEAMATRAAMMTDLIDIYRYER
jgi:hypothetical protein